MTALVARTHGYADLPRVIIPHPFESLPRPDVIEIAEESFPRALAALQARTVEQPVKATARR
jgi:hypothetical protein